LTFASTFAVGAVANVKSTLLDAVLAGVAELVDALDLGSSDESCGGSSPSARTKREPGLRMTMTDGSAVRWGFFPFGQGPPNHRRRR
jgi:hypothetical protein